MENGFTDQIWRRVYADISAQMATDDADADADDDDDDDDDAL